MTHSVRKPAGQVIVINSAVLVLDRNAAAVCSLSKDAEGPPESWQLGFHLQERQLTKVEIF